MSEINVAVVLAAGQGKRMNSNQKKQYLLIEDKPMLFYSLQIFEKASYISAIIVVTGKGEEKYVQEQIVDLYGLHKVAAIVEGGIERYHSVYNGLKAIGGMKTLQNCEHVFIHDGARPFLTEDILCRGLECVRKYAACVVGMPVKDTIKIADEEGYIYATPDRNRVWAVQTPQIFQYKLVMEAYKQLLEQELLGKGVCVTDDAMVVEKFTDKLVKLVMGDYKNIKITTPEDLQIASVFRQKQ